MYERINNIKNKQVKNYRLLNRYQTSISLELIHTLNKTNPELHSFSIDCSVVPLLTKMQI